MQMTNSLATVRTVADLRAQVRTWRQDGLRVGFVPTMGALHRGHLSLVQTALSRVDRVIASVFVNPSQFGPNEDFQAYPRQESTDADLLADTGAHLLYAPTVTEMYPPGFATTVTVAGVSAGLCGEVRPGHFAGVATVVTKLLLQALPDVAVFGEKDYQQLQVIRRLVRDLDIPVTVIGAATVREPDGLALSSRNAYLSAEERSVAPAIYRVLTSLAERLRLSDEAAAPLLAAGSVDLRHAGFSSVDYLELRDAETLAPLTHADRPARLLVAARLAKTRLIDNIAV